MSDTQDRPHLTVEDAGSTTDPADLTSSGVGHAASRDEDPAEPAHVVARAADGTGARNGTAATDGSGTAHGDPLDQSGPPATTSGLSALIADDDIGHVFDQTNGVVDGIDGDSDGTADSDISSGAERHDENPAFERFADTEPQRVGESDDTRITGD